MEWEQGAEQRQWRDIHEWAEHSQNMRGESTPGEQQFKKILLREAAEERNVGLNGQRIPRGE